MLNILINAYAVAPNWGSEQGVGWNWITNIAKYCNCYIITEGEWRKEIECALRELPQRDNIHFYYNPVSDKVRKMCWNQGDWRFYYHYAQWQKKTLKIAQQICCEYKIDVIHHLNMVGFREPGLLWKINGPSYVWGPLSGCSITNLSYFKGAGIKAKLKYAIKNVVNWWQVHYDYKVRAAFKRADVLITPRGDVHNLVNRIYGKESLIIPETGITGKCVPMEKITPLENGCFNILWVGRFIYTKKLDIALNTIAKLKHLPNLKLHIVGFGMNGEEQFYKDMAVSLGIEDVCVWYGRQDNTRVMELMQQMDVFFFTSIAEVTSTVILESMQNRLPIVCHDACGFGPLIDETIGRKVSLTNPSQAVNDFALSIEELYNNRTLLSAMRGNFDDKVEKLTYEYKGELMCQIYKDLVHNKD